MIYKNFRVHIILRLVLLSASLLALFYLLNAGTYYLTPVVLIVLIIIQIYSLIRLVEKTNHDLSNFLQSIRFSDFSSSFQNEGLGDSYDHLRSIFNNVIKDFQKIRSEKEEHYFYLQNIVQHIGVGIIAYRRDGSVEMINKASKRLFQISKLKNIGELSRCSAELVDVLLKIQMSENTLVKVYNGEEFLQLSIYATEFKLNNRTIVLVSIRNIQAELAEQEMDAWQKLIRVLTHEIMNSIAPISSLSSTLSSMVEEIANSENKNKVVDIETVNDIQDALKTIYKRSTGLSHFVETYRNLTQIPAPDFSIFFVEPLLKYIVGLFKNELNKKSIQVEIHVQPATLELTADEQLLEQVLINLLQNSIQAAKTDGTAHIQIKAFLNKRGRITIQVIDNGQGILEEVQQKIFIPFFTTKHSGSGIGLSLSRQILRLHGGSINVQSQPDVKTVFTLTF